MGMYSAFCCQDIKVKNRLILQKLNMEAKIEKGEELDDKYYGLIQEDGKIDFSAWDGHKIQGYWYAETVDTLHLIAPYIEGFAEFEYEEGYKFRIVFKNGTVYLQIQPEPEWDNIEMSEL